MTVLLESAVAMKTVVGWVAGGFLVGVIVGRFLRGRAPTPAAPPIALPAEIPPAVVAALAAGRKIDAIRAYREATGADLKTAKEICDALERGAPPSA
jgi:hypothetical protein